MVKERIRLTEERKAKIISTEMWRKYENGLVDIFGSEKEVKEIVDAVETED